MHVCMHERDWHVDVVDSGNFECHLRDAADWDAIAARREEQNLLL